MQNQMQLLDSSHKGLAIHSFDVVVVVVVVSLRKLSNKQLSYDYE